MLLSAGPFIGYLASRFIGLPGDQKDVGNWGDWLGTVSLVVEAALVLLSISMLLKIFNSGGYEAGDGRCAVLCRGDEVSRWRWTDRG